MSRKRFVLNTNVIVSAVLLPRSIPRQAFDLAFIQGIVLVSESTLDELDKVLRRPPYIIREQHLTSRIF
jgi:uncharacterized protein